MFLGILARAVDEASHLLDIFIPYVSISGLARIFTKTYEKRQQSGSKKEAYKAGVISVIVVIIVIITPIRHVEF